MAGEKRTIDMARAGDDHVGAILSTVRYAKRLGGALRRWITGTLRGTVHITAVCFVKSLSVRRVDGCASFAIDLSRRYVQHALKRVVDAIVQQV